MKVKQTKLTNQAKIKAFKKLQQILQLTPEKAAQWQLMVQDARR